MEIDSCHKQLLIVGGSGFIGRHVVKEALKQGFDVTVLSKKHGNAVSRLDNVHYIFADISHKESLSTAIKDKVFDYVINLGGYVDHTNYSNGGSKVCDVHFDGVRNLVDCLDCSRIKGFVQIGSGDEYGNISAPQSETQRESPISPYSCAKVASTYFLQTLYKTEGFPAVVLRPFLVYGPEQSAERFIPQIINGCINNQKFSTSKGEQLRDFCFIDDFVKAVFFALSNKHAHGEVINIASGEPITIKKTINMIVSMIGYGQPQFGKIPYRKGENMALYGNIDKAEKILGWKPSIDLNEGLLKTVKWFRDTNNE
jgi:nucleoside-diphosphate-sugar epimerase